MPSERLKCEGHFFIPTGRRDTGNQRRHGMDRVASKLHSFCVFLRKKGNYNNIEFLKRILPSPCILLVWLRTDLENVNR
jgi:hypothetical protein